MTLTAADKAAVLVEALPWLGRFHDATIVVKFDDGKKEDKVLVSKAGNDARGHSVIDGAQDTELKVVAGPEPLRGQSKIEKQ
mgnify:CR=1 FL=1